MSDENSVAPIERVNLKYKSRAEGGQDVEKGYRAALWYAMGLAGLGLVLAAVAALADTLWPADPEEGATLHIGRRKGKERPKRRSLAVGISPSP